MRNASFSVRGVRRRAWDSSSAMSFLCAMLSAKHSVNSWQPRLRSWTRTSLARIVSRLTGCVAGLLQNHGAVAADDKHRYGIDRRLLRVSDDPAAGWEAWVTTAPDPTFIMVLTIRTTGRDRRAPSLSALAAADPGPRAS
jgi:hypothetical protein